MFLDAPIDPDVPTDPEELALYRKYGKNWKTVLSGTNRRDRGGNVDRGMRFFHTSPEGFLTKPRAMSQMQMQNSDISSSGLFSELERMRAQYNAYLQELYALQNTPAYEQQQDYYYNNYMDLYGNQGDNTSQTNQYMSPPEPAPAPAPVAAPAAPIQLMPPAATPAPVVSPQRPVNVAAATADARGAYDSPIAVGANGGNPPAQPSMSDQFITRYDRDVQDQKVKSKPAAVPKTPIKQYKPVRAI